MFPYENLEVYKKAYLTNQKVYRMLKGNKSIPGYAKDQLGRASLSIVLNIAEGSAKFSNKDRRSFYITARGSAFECASLINFLNDEEEVDDDRADRGPRARVSVEERAGRRRRRRVYDLCEAGARCAAIPRNTKPAVSPHAR